MVQIDPIDRLMRAALLSDEEFVGVLNDILEKDLRITIRELSTKVVLPRVHFIKFFTAGVPRTFRPCGQLSAHYDGITGTTKRNLSVLSLHARYST